jgi:hypothetical protein
MDVAVSNKTLYQKKEIDHIYHRLSVQPPELLWLTEISVPLEVSYVYVENTVANSTMCH